VIFDLDGVLVDSERLAVRVEAEVLDRLGWPIGEAGVIARFLGRSQRHMHTEVERELGHPIDWDATFGTAHREAFDAELAPIEGVPEVLAALAAADVTVCVASSSTREAIADKLGRTGLAGAFGDRVFSVEDVPREKPAPDVSSARRRRSASSPATAPSSRTASRAWRRVCPRGWRSTPTTAGSSAVSSSPVPT